MTNFARFVENKSIYPFSIILGDINGLKVVNDAFGRKAGDSVIKRIADIIKGTCSPTDILGKWGGDEFIIISPNSTQGYAQEVIRKIKERCGRDDHSIKLSISFGHAIKRSEHDNPRIPLSKPRPYGKEQDLRGREPGARQSTSS